MDIVSMEARYIINTYGREAQKSLYLQRGKGARVWDEKGRGYLDFLGGLAVNALGHCHPRVVAAVKEQAEALMHASNLYYTAPQAQLARVLAESSLGGRIFFANSGAEANEAAIKLARKHAHQNHGKKRPEIITALRSFHGRTLTTVAATAQERHQKGFEPLPEGFVYAAFNDLEAFSNAVDEETCAIMMEPIQGEGGIYPADPEFLKGLRRLCDQNNLLLIFDEIQCGMGRTGKLWAYQDYGVEPDLFTAAKALGGGLPIGALVCSREISSTLTPGDHASTFGGNPVACRAALAVMEVLLQEGLLEQVSRRSEALCRSLEQIRERVPGSIKEIRGRGLMLGVELSEPVAPELHRECQSSGLLVNPIGTNIIRLLPPYVITDKEVEEFSSIFQGALQSVLEKEDKKHA